MYKIIQRLSVIVLLLIPVFSANQADATLINTTISGDINLYYDNWGHPYNIASAAPQTEYNALGTGTAPTSIPYVFSSGQNLNITASDCVIDAGSSCTGPNGQSWIFRSLPAYSLIGIWSADSIIVNPVGGGSNPAFFVGSLASLTAPTYSGDLYLFLGENDGIFTDNPSSYHYSVSLDITDVPVPEPSTISLDITNVPVPEPSTMLLLGSGLGGLFAFRKKFKK